MTTIPLRSNVADRLKVEAERRRISVEALANDWLEDQLWREKHKKIQEEAERFRAKHTELYAQYAGRYIAMRDGGVLDHDADLVALHDRIRARYGDEPVLIAPVTAEPTQTFKVVGSRQRKQSS